MKLRRFVRRQPREQLTKDAVFFRVIFSGANGFVAALKQGAKKALYHGNEYTEFRLDRTTPEAKRGQLTAGRSPTESASHLLRGDRARSHNPLGGHAGSARV